MNAQKIAATVLAIAVLIVLGYAAQASPQLKEHATTVAIVVLAALSISGILAALIAPFTRTHVIARHKRPTAARATLASTSTGARS